MRWQSEGHSKTGQGRNAFRAPNGYTVARKGSLWTVRGPSGKVVKDDDGNPLLFRKDSLARKWVEAQA